MSIKNKVNFLVTIEARMNSTRLPGKVCMQLEKSKARMTQTCFFDFKNAVFQRRIPQKSFMLSQVN